MDTEQRILCLAARTALEPIVERQLVELLRGPIDWERLWAQGHLHEVLPLLTRPIPNFDMTYAPGALKALYTATHGQPFLTQALAFELVQYLNEQRHTEATLEAVEVAITRALQAGDSYFANVWNDVGSEGQAILRALVCGETLPDIPEALSWLREHDVLNDAGTFAVPMVERWVREHIVKG